MCKDCPKHRRPRQKGGGKGSRSGIGLVESFHAGFVESIFAGDEVEDDPWQEIEDILAAWDHRTRHEHSRCREKHYRHAVTDYRRKSHEKLPQHIQELFKEMAHKQIANVWKDAARHAASDRPQQRYARQ